jgi:hypothetical protein
MSRLQGRRTNTGEQHTRQQQQSPSGGHHPHATKQQGRFGSGHTTPHAPGRRGPMTPSLKAYLTKVFHASSSRTDARRSASRPTNTTPPKIICHDSRQNTHRRTVRAPRAQKQLCKVTRKSGARGHVRLIAAGVSERARDAALRIACMVGGTLMTGPEFGPRVASAESLTSVWGL